MTIILASLLLVLAFVFTGLDAAWLALDRVRLRHRADKGDRHARQMMAWEACGPQANLVMAWTSHACAAAALVLFSASLTADGAEPWLVPLVFVPFYAVVVQLLSRQVFRRLPFMVLSRSWWLVSLAGSVWAVLARPAAALVRRVKSDPLSRPSAAEELMALAQETPGISPLELSMLRSVLDFRRLTAADLALPVDRLAHAPADRTLAEMLAERRLSDARYTLVVGADGVPLGAVSCASAALSGALSARAQSFARPLLTVSADLSSWKLLAKLRRTHTPVAEVREGGTGRFLGIITEETAVARLLGKPV